MSALKEESRRCGRDERGAGIVSGARRRLVGREVTGEGGRSAALGISYSVCEFRSSSWKILPKSATVTESIRSSVDVVPKRVSTTMLGSDGTS